MTQRIDQPPRATDQEKLDDLTALLKAAPDLGPLLRDLIERLRAETPTP